ncbi:MAG: 2-phosphosulfolactate phosphatase [Bacteroidales bacterium]|nr:2-phosphosulfolactate phosphatase [Bacteroidales bacterium]MBN2818323.1 2-phosphosulfolactate phosphatase [Bacteroidales bacterium]
MSHKRNIEVCFTPATYEHFKNNDAIVVVVDILRATSAIVTAFMHGVKRIIPVGTLEEAKEYKSRGYMVAAERDGIVRDFADFGNSPYNFSPENVGGKEVCYSTTNGTHSIMMARESYRVLIGAYLNHQALVNYITKENRDLLILCAGWKGKFNLEDSLFAGALAETLIETGKFETICDSTLASIDLWNAANINLMAYIDKVAQRHRLAKNGLDDVIEYCHGFDMTNLIPVLKENFLVEISDF